MEGTADQPPVQRLDRIAIVAPHAWHLAHPTNDHALELATGIEQELHGSPAPRAVIIAPSLRANKLRATRRAVRDLARGGDPDVVLSRDGLLEMGSDGVTQVCVLSVGLPLTLGKASVALRANMRILFEHAGIDSIHVLDPAEPFGRAALTLWPGLASAAPHDDHKPLHKRAMESIDLEVDLPQLSASHASGDEARTTIVLGRGELDDADTPRTMRELTPLLAEREDLSLVLLSRWALHHRPNTPRALRGRVRTIAARTRSEADAVLRTAACYVAFAGTPERGKREALAAGVPVVEVGSDFLGRVDAALNAAPAPLELPSEQDIARQLIAAASGLLAKRHTPHMSIRLPAVRSCMIDLHMHTDHSWDCATDPEALLWTAREVGLTAIAVTDHNEVSGAKVCAELSEEYGVQVIVGEEIMTAEGEVIGLFLDEKIEPGQSWEATLEQIRAQDGLVYVPHPFDRLHTIPDAATLRATVDQIDALETYNSRLAFEQYNRDAQRFARKYNLAEGAGSDAHVTQSLGTAAVHMPAWDDPESFLAALRQGEIVRRPKSYMYLQGLKFLQTRGKKTEKPEV
jgi:predicted metal-dependent phosphoesterase TrpH